MAKLNQIIAIASTKKTEGKRELTDVYKRLQKAPLFEGIARTYKPLDEDGDTFPDERKQIQYSVNQALNDARAALTDFFNVVATQDYANCEARADVVVDGQTVLTDVPVTHLIFLEKQLVDLYTFVRQIPTLDPAEEWHFDENAGCYASRPFRTNKSKKVPRNHVLYDATPEHPAQVEVVQEDVKVGEWQTIKFSGAIPVTERNAMLQRIVKFQDALKFAREQANSKDAPLVNNGNKVLDFVFGAQA